MKLHVLHKARRIDAIARSDGWATIDPAGVESQGVGSGDEGGVGAPGCQSHGAASGHHMEMCAAVLLAAVLLPPPTPSCPSNMNDRQVEQDSCGGMAASAF